MSTIINGTSNAVTFPDSSVQNTSAIVSGYVPYANLPAGSVLQVVQGTTSTAVSTTNNTYIDTGLTATITPKFSTSKILVIFHHNGTRKSGTNVNNSLGLRLFRASTNIAQLSLDSFYTGDSLNLQGQTLSTAYLDSPATTSATTYKTQFNNNSGSTGVYLQQDSALSTITLMEIAA